MTMPVSGARIAFSDLQTVFNGEHPISIDEYYQDASTGYTSGVTGIPNINSGIPDIKSPISLYMFYDKAKPVSSGILYSFTTHTFTNAGATGRTGPILSQVQTAYSTVSWAQNNSYLNMVTQGIQEWTVPATGSYYIDVAGAAGGDGGYGRGKGARMIGTFNLTKGMVLAILVGQQGVVKNSGCNAGGGGGTFVWNKGSTTQPLIVGGGGGGGGAGCSLSGLDAPITMNGTGGFGTSAAGVNGNGATPGGSGWLSNGTSGLDGNNSSTTRPLEGGLGGLALSYNSVGDGGFGGGASASGQNCGNGGAGGGGGYSGGAGPSGDATCNSGGGGGSYNSGTDQINTAGINTGHGFVTINFLSPPPTLYSFTTHRFTNAGATGRTGPIISQVRSEYSAASWAQNASYLNMVTQGIQEWTVPATGSYSIQVVGAGGGNSSGYGGGGGARMIGTFNLTQGMVLAILVGQQGVVKTSGCNAGGGGGTFVWDKNFTTQPLIVGGGGGGCNACGGTRGLDAPTTINGTGGFGTAAAGSNGYGATPGGSGWLSNGTSGLDGNNSDTKRPLEGGLGGAALSYNSIGDGGFGGGASASGQGCSNGGAGGGGGYSGGAGPSGDATCGSGGGGGSYNSGTNQNNAVGVNAGHGYVIIDYLSSTAPAPPPASSSLYSFTTHRFTNAGATGRTGPIISQVRSEYSAASWAQNASYLNMVTQGIQEWTVPATGSYSIQVVGAGGGNSSGYGGGGGARMIGTFNLTQGMVLAILVGQQGVVKTSGCNAGGGGGTFVWDKNFTTQPLIVGGGGGGCNACGGTRGLDAPTTINGTGGFGTAAAGSNGYGATPGGSGWLSNGTSGLDGNNSDTKRPLEGGLGGAALSYNSIGDGGFGGGASASGQGCSNGGAGGGGGYSGGAGPSGDATCGSGGGGGSYNSGTNQNNAVGVNAGHGYVIITVN